MATPNLTWEGYWPWVNWTLGEGKYRLYGPRYGPVRPKLPYGGKGQKPVPPEWWARIKKFIAARKAPLPAPLPPPPKYPLPAAFWREDAVGVVVLSNLGDSRHILFGNGGYKRLDVLLAEGDTIKQENVDELRLLANELRIKGVTVVGWHSTTSANPPHMEAETGADAFWAADNALRYGNHKLSGWNLNAEDWYEHANSWKTGAYWDAFDRELTQVVPKAVWPLGSDTGSSARSFDYLTCLARGCMVYPQQYQNVNPLYTLMAGDLNLAFAGVPDSHRGTSPGVYREGAKPVPWDSYIENARVLHSMGDTRPILLYGADMSGFDAVKAVALRKAMRGS